MDDSIENNVVDQAVPVEANNHESEAIQEQTKAVEESRQERNWKASREKQKELERELRLQREMNERLLSMASQAAVKPEVDEFDSIGDDEYISKGKVQAMVLKKATKLAEDISQRKIDEALLKREQGNFHANLQRKYSDFDETVNAETIALLEENDPELAQTIADLKDPYKMGVQSYKFIKALGLTDKVPDARRAKEIDKKLEKNSKTVQSPQVYDKRPMAQAFKMTATEKSALYSEMMGYAQQAGAAPLLQ